MGVLMFGNLMVGNERQKHGFWYENIIFEKYGLLKCKDYTSEYDFVCNDLKIQYQVWLCY